MGEEWKAARTSKRGVKPENWADLAAKYRVSEIKTRLAPSDPTKLELSQCHRLVYSWMKDEAAMSIEDRNRRNIITHALEKGGTLEEWYLRDIRELKGKNLTPNEIEQADALLWVRRMGVVREHYYYLEEPDRIPFVTAMVKEFGLPIESSEQDLIQKIVSDLSPVVDLHTAKIVNQTRNDFVYDLGFSRAMKDEINDTHFDSTEALLEYLKSKVENIDEVKEKIKEIRGGSKPMYGLENLGQLFHVLHSQRFKVRLTAGRQWLGPRVVESAQKCRRYCPALEKMLLIASVTSPRPGFIFANSIPVTDIQKWGLNEKDLKFGRVSDKGRCFALRSALDVGPSVDLAVKENEQKEVLPPSVEKVVGEKQVVEAEKSGAKDEVPVLTNLMSKSRPFLGPQRKTRATK